MAPNAACYMGSPKRGGRVDFDYDSITMTSSKHNLMFKVPESKVDSVGQRYALSKGDIDMINDMYSCTEPVTKEATEVATNLYKMDSALKQEIQASSAKNFARNLKDLEQAEKYVP